MRIALPVVTALALSAAAASAHAGGYVAAGLGSEAGLGGDLATRFSTDGTSTGRLMVGERFGPLALEASLFGTDLRGTTSMVGVGAELSTLSLGLDLKYHIKLVGRLEAYARGGLHKTWVSAGGDRVSDFGHRGRGYQYGGGLQYAFSLGPLLGAAVWVDYGHQVLDLADESRPSLQGSTDMVTFGVSFGRL